MKYVWPDEKTMCHRTSFTKTCLECVKDHGCRLWKHVTLEGDPRLELGATQSAVNHWDCADSLTDLYLRDMLRRQLQTTATVDKLSKEVAQNNAGAMGALLGGINQTLQQIAAPNDEPPLLNGGGPKLIGN